MVWQLFYQFWKGVPISWIWMKRFLTGYRVAGSGETRDALCGIHHFEPWTRKGLPQAWKVFSVWRKLESPNRAPPLTAQIIDAWIMYAISHCDLEFAAMLCLGFYGLLRTGELLQSRPCDLLLGPDTGVISLTDTKTGLLNAAKETVSITSFLAIETLHAAVAMKNQQGLHKVPIWSKSASSFRKVFAHHIKRFDLQSHEFRPYSLRRGGATALFQQTGSMEQALLKGRWNSSKVAKIYLADGLSFLPGLRFSQKSKEMLHRWSPDMQLRERLRALIKASFSCRPDCSSPVKRKGPWKPAHSKPLP